MKFPMEFEKRMRTMLGAEADAFFAAFSDADAANSGIRINTLKNGAAEAIAEATGKAAERVKWCPDAYYADKSVLSGTHPYHAAGLFYFQEPSATAAVEALGVERGDLVLDLCAAPGGKSTQAAAKLRGEGILVANELVPSRAAILSENIERMGIRNAVVMNESPDKLVSVFPHFFNKIIVDAPCSGEGMFRKEPRAVSDWSIEHTLSCAARQKHILDSAVEMLAPQGRLVYSTCTFAPAEDECIAEYLIREKHLIPLAIDVNADPEAGRSEWTEHNTDVAASRRIFPHKEKGEGHYLALFAASAATPSVRATFAPPKQTVAETEAIGLFRAFEKEYMTVKAEGCFKLFGDTLYLINMPIPTDGLKIPRYGLRLGECKKDRFGKAVRFEPSHSLALASEASDFVNVLDLSPDDKHLRDYLTGNVIPCGKNGWCAVCVSGFPLGWGKASQGQLKNKYPKSLRLV